MEQQVTVGLSIQNRKVRADFIEILSRVSELSLHEFAPGKPYDLLILDVGEDWENQFDQIHAIQTSGLVKEFFLTSCCMEPDFLIRALRTGAREFIPQPVKKEDVTAAIRKFIEKRKGGPAAEKTPQKQCRIIHVIGSKGGVGTTTIAVNLAASLIKSSTVTISVALVDMNFLFGEIPTFLNIKPEFNWGEVARNFARIDAHYLMSIFSRHKNGIYVLPSPTSFDGSQVSSPDFIEKILMLMRTSFDFIIIDGGQSLDEVSVKIMQMTDILCIVGILSLPCLTNMKRLLRTFETLGYPRKEQIRIIINRYHKKSLISLKEAEAALDWKISALIDNDYQSTMSAINQGKTLESIAPQEEVTRNIRSLALGLLGSQKA